MTRNLTCKRALNRIEKFKRNSMNGKKQPAQKTSSTFSTLRKIKLMHKEL